TGSTIAWLMQAFRPRGEQRLWHDFNNTAMGWSIPAAIASALACPEKPVYCVVGDGSLMMNLQELATVIAYDLPLKIICLDNKGYSMIQQTQDQWLGGQYVASSSTGGLRMPDLLDVARSFGLPVSRLSCNADIATCLDGVTSRQGAFFLLVDIDPACRVSPQVKFGRPNEDPEPLLDRETFLSEMIIPPLDVSRSA
ncbi:MAG: thiamine pyrophosphate-dependent enzyme, partial [Gammaproteobacteria bacterium]